MQIVKSVIARKIFKEYYEIKKQIWMMKFELRVVTY